MDTLKLMMYGKVVVVPKNQIKDIDSGRALTTTGRWFDIVCDQCETDAKTILAQREVAIETLCDQCEIDCEIVLEDERTNIPESYIVCNICNKVTYINDLRP